MKERLEGYKLLLNTKRFLVYILLAILGLNGLMYLITEQIEVTGIQRRLDASGFSYDRAKPFIYFYYYTGYFPLATLDEEKEYSEEGAWKEIEEDGEDLIMEFEHWSRLGENARIWAFMPNAWIKGSPEEPSIKLFNTILFVFSLMILFVGFWRLRLAWLGLIAVLLINFTLFFIFEVYENENVFSYLGATYFTMTGLFIVSLLKGDRPIYYLISSLAIGLMIGFLSEMRNELAVCVAAAMLFILFAKKQKVLIKVLALAICFFSYYSLKQSINQHFKKEFQITKNFVAEKGGHVYTGDHIKGHLLWHPIFCGLGDFDDKYGFEWNDRVAYRYAIPILEEKLDMEINYSEKFHLDNYYDADSIYYVKFDELEGYDEIIKDKVVYHIEDDPMWYATIIFKRIARTLSRTLPLPFLGWLMLFLFYYLYKEKRWDYIGWIITALPLSATTILIYSGDGATYNSVYGYVVVMIVLLILNERYLEQRLEARS